MASRRRLETTALIGLLAQAVFTVVCFAMASPKVTASLAVAAHGWFFMSGILLWLIVLLHGRQRRRTHEEREDMAELKRVRLSDELFDDREMAELREHAGLATFERFVVPAVSIVLALGLLALCVWHIRSASLAGWSATAAVATRKPLAGAVGLAIIFFAGLLVGKYCVALSQSREFRMLRSAGAFMLGNAALSFVVAFGLVMVHFGAAQLERSLSFIVPGIMGLIGIEFLLNMLLDVYRPRMPGEETRPPYDSRLLGLIAQPGSMVKTIAATLDYQFGFKVSETWFYRFMGRAIIPLIIVQVVVLWLLSCIVIVRPGEMAFIEHWGKPVLTAQDKQANEALPPEERLEASVFESGLHLKAPWPVEVARPIDAGRIYRREIGKIRYEESDIRQRLSKGILTITDTDYVLWDEVHIAPKDGYEATFLAPSAVSTTEAEETPAVNIARLEAEVHYRARHDGKGAVDKKALYQLQYGFQDVDKLVEHLAYGAMCQLSARQDFLKWVHVNRASVSGQFEALMRDVMVAHGTGLEVVYAGIPIVHPPPEVAEAFRGVINAYEIMEKTVHEGRTGEHGIVWAARGAASEIIDSAGIYANYLRTVAEKDAERFAIQSVAYRLAPDVYRYRKYLSAAEEALDRHRIYVVPVRRQEVQIINLENRDVGITDMVDIAKESFK